MEKRVAEMLADFIGVEARHDYSGRGMYGRETSGVVIESVTDLVGCMLQNAEELAEEVKALQEEGVEMPGGFRTDSMGYDTIVY